MDETVRGIIFLLRLLLLPPLETGFQGGEQEGGEGGEMGGGGRGILFETWEGLTGCEFHHHQHHHHPHHHHPLSVPCDPWGRDGRERQQDGGGREKGRRER